MANPYYIPKRRSPLLDYAQLGLQLYGIKERAATAKAGQALTAKELGLRGEKLEEEKRIGRIQYGTSPTVAPGPDYMPGASREQLLGTPGTVQRGITATERLGELKAKRVGIQE
ncbi:unnamed protein product, partial [marine sediment metagenome]